MKNASSNHVACRELTRQEKATIRSNWSEITRYLPAPGIAWGWSEVSLSDRMKHYLRHHGLIHRDPDDQECWLTTEPLWVYIIERAGNDEEIGAEARGQCKLPIDTSSRRSSIKVQRVDLTAHHQSRQRTETQQMTLTGDPIDSVEPVNLPNIDESNAHATVNACKDATRLTGSKKAAHHQVQMQLDDKWCATVIDAAGSGYWVIQKHTTTEKTNPRLLGV